ncbi:hypothetical protein J1605_011190 [Eschrichtius robustus]|uniref:Serine/threonine-protein phosphatase 4 regulatory subunit 3-like central domain-containing protein n=1 Tax=Eschrichtius robustus TaxID=9764 RepID=A0AB34GR08_ESCRO|nr:hypothetical protein J1605_011190 [Eschrichtius robustus]
MICDTDPELGGAVQLMGLLRTLIDPENMLATTNVRNYSAIETFWSNNIVGSNKNSTICPGALRFMRRIIGLKDEFYNRYITKGNLFEPVINALLDNGTRYNLLNSAVIELFEFIRVEDIKSLTTHIVENFYKALESIEYVQTFKGLKTKYEQEKDRQNQKLNSVPSILRSNRFRRDAKALEEDEEMWFNEDEEEEGKTVVAPVEKSKAEDDFPDSYEKFMETKKGIWNVIDLWERLLGFHNEYGSVESIQIFTFALAKESEDKENLPKRTSSGGFKFTFSHSTSAANGTNSTNSKSVVAQTPPASSNGSSSKTTNLATSVTATKGSLVGLVDYPDDEEEDEEEETSPRKRPRLGS